MLTFEQTKKGIDRGQDGKLYEIKRVYEGSTSQQKRALRKLWQIMTEKMEGQEFNPYELIKDLEIPHTVGLMEFLWRTIQYTLYGTESTKDANTEVINKVFDVFCNLFAQVGIQLEFPSRDLQSFKEWYLDKWEK
jgi:hypothetical protein